MNYCGARREWVDKEISVHQQERIQLDFWPTIDGMFIFERRWNKWMAQKDVFFEDLRN